MRCCMRNTEYSSIANTRSLDERFCSKCPLMYLDIETTHLMADGKTVDVSIDLKCVHYADCAKMLRYVADNDLAYTRLIEMVLEERKNRQ